MYRMKKKPPEIPLNDCIVRYKQSGDEKYLQYFLHFYESKLNWRTEDFCERYGQLNHFQDIKQIIVTTIVTQIDKYDPDAGANLITFTDKHVDAAVHDYIRQNCGVICASEYDYDNLRNIMFIFNEVSESTETERIQTAMDKTGLSEKAVRQHLQHGDMFQYSESLTGGYRDDEDGYMQLIERIGDIYDSPEYLVLEKLFYEALVIAVDELPRKESRLICGYYGLERHENRFTEIEPIPKQILAARLHIGKIQAVDDNVRRAVALLRTELKKQGWIEGKKTPMLVEAQEKLREKLQIK